MKPFSNFSNHLKAISFSVLLLGLPNGVTAQDIHYRDPNNPAKGYWQLFTDAESRTTNVKFFDANQQMLYQEIMPGRFIKLTNRNITRINLVFDQIAGKSMVEKSVKSASLTSADFKKLINRNSKKRYNNVEESTLYKENPASGLAVHTYQIADKTDYYLTIQNPQQEQVFIYLFNKINQNIYWEKVQKTDYRRKFNFEGMPQEEYKLVVTTADKKLKYTKKIDLRSTHRTQQVVPLHTPVLISTVTGY
jgi:hypothetical protein